MRRKFFFFKYITIRNAGGSLMYILKKILFVDLDIRCELPITQC